MFSLQLFSFILRAADFLSDIYYISTEEFVSDTLHIVAVIFLLAPTAFILVIFLFSLVRELCRSSHPNLGIKLLFGSLFVIGEPIGLSSLGFALYYLRSSHSVEYKDVIEMVTRTSNLIEALLESLPQMIIQLYNSPEIKFILIFSVTASSLSMLYSCLRLLYVLDIVSLKQEDEVPEHNALGYDSNGQSVNSVKVRAIKATIDNYVGS